MSFQNINKIDSSSNEKSCAILYNFSAKELTMLKNICGLIGIKEKIILNSENGNTLVKNILNNELNNDCDVILNHKAVIFNNIDSSKIHSFMDALKKFRFGLPLIAVVTETSIDWDLNTLVSNLAEERDALKSGKKINH
ncbi:MAG: DUF3783 domain-containing protein [Peptostreptococcaceae bacterium]